MAIIKVNPQSVIATRLYPIDVPAINFIGYQLPVAPGSQKTGDVDNADINDAYPGVVIIGMGSDNTDKFSVRASRAIGNFSSFEVTIFNPDGADFTGTLTWDSNVDYAGTITGIYAFLQSQEKNVLEVVLKGVV